MKLSDYAAAIDLFSPIETPDHQMEGTLFALAAEIEVDPMSRPFCARYPRPKAASELRRWVRAALTVRAPGQLSDRLANLADNLLTAECSERQETDAAQLPRLGDSGPLKQVSLWNGDTTTLRIGAITNAANAQMLGCFQPFHACIDNSIHAVAGPRLREDCATLMRLQGAEEPSGTAKITRGYNLPARYVLHTVGPIIRDGQTPTTEDTARLANCYHACLTLAAEAGARSVALCGISTGVFGYPAAPAARVAFDTVIDWLARRPNALDFVVFNTFGPEPTALYRQIAADHDQ